MVVSDSDPCEEALVFYEVDVRARDNHPPLNDNELYLFASFEVLGIRRTVLLPLRDNGFQRTSDVWPAYLARMRALVEPPADFGEILFVGGRVYRITLRKPDYFLEWGETLEARIPQITRIFQEFGVLLDNSMFKQKGGFLQSDLHREAKGRSAIADNPALRKRFNEITRLYDWEADLRRQLNLKGYNSQDPLAKFIGELIETAEPHDELWEKYSAGMHDALGQSLVMSAVHPDISDERFPLFVAELDAMFEFLQLRINQLQP